MLWALPPVILLKGERGEALVQALYPRRSQPVAATRDQSAINNDDGLPNAFSESLPQPAIPQRDFLCRPRTTPKSLTYRPTIDLFPLR
jgi:hypothetical protein